jgi:hypothetical protein
MARWLVVAAALVLSACADRYIPVAATAPDKAADPDAARATCREQAAAAAGNATLLGPVAGVLWGAAQGAATGALSGGSAEGAAIGAAAGLVVGAVAGVVADQAESTAAMDRCLVAHGYQRS